MRLKPPQSQKTKRIEQTAKRLFIMGACSLYRTHNVGRRAEVQRAADKIRPAGRKFGRGPDGRRPAEPEGFRNPARRPRVAVDRPDVPQRGKLKRAPLPSRILFSVSLSMNVTQGSSDAQSDDASIWRQAPDDPTASGPLEKSPAGRFPRRSPKAAIGRVGTFFEEFAPRLRKSIRTTSREESFDLRISPFALSRTFGPIQPMSPKIAASFQDSCRDSRARKAGATRGRSAGSIRS